jgi:hypothetical protein
MIKWPIKAMKSISIFFVKWNDFDLYVEDTAKHANSIYNSLIGRLTEGNCKIYRVFQLGSRACVIEAAKSDDESNKRRRLYLVDSDLDLISGENQEEIKRLFYHRVYHLENYFLCKSAIITVLQEENPTLSEEKILEKLDYDNWMLEIKPLFGLFKIFGMTKLLDPSLPTISLKIGRFWSNQKIDNQKISDFCTTRHAELASNFTEMEISDASKKIDDAIGGYAYFTDLISARDFLFPNLKPWVKTKGLNLNCSNETLFLRLSKHCELTRHNDLIEAVRACANG